MNTSHPTTTDNLEQLLQQYGRDTRSQQTAVRNIRSAARRQRRAAAALASLAILTVAALWLLQRPMPTESTPIATATIPTRQSTPTPLPVPPKATPLPAATATAASNIPSLTLQPLATPKAPHCAPPLVAQAEPASPQPLADKTTQHNPETTQPSVTNPPPRSTHPLRLAAEVGASLAGGVAAQSPMGNSRLQATVGLSLALAQGRRYSLSLGLGMSGHMRTDAAHITTKSEYSFNGMISPNDFTYSSNDQNGDITENTILHPYYDPLFSLYATLPLALDLFPSGRGNTGLQLTLTPAHSVALSRHSSLLNPWKLNIGLGLTLPQSPIRSIGLSANLLPSFTGGPYKNIHEISLLFGF